MIVVVWLGGNGHNWPHQREFNFGQDLNASRVIFDSGVPFVQCPCRPVVTHFTTTVPEMERYVITQSCVVYIPPGFIHAPWRPLKTYRPWVFVEVNQGLKHTEKFYPQLLTKEQREQTDWSLWKDEGY